MVVLGVEDPPGVPDPFLRASRAAVRVLLGELSREFSPDGIRVAEVRGDAMSLENPESCADAVIRALKDPIGPDAAPRAYRA